MRLALAFQMNQRNELVDMTDAASCVMRPGPLETVLLMADGTCLQRSTGPNRRWEDADQSLTVDAAGHGPRTATAVVDTAVRRLTPTECCRLQGFPDDWFGTPNEAPDGPRYAALGDAVTVNVAEWIGRRIGSHDSSGDAT